MTDTTETTNTAAPEPSPWKPWHKKVLIGCGVGFAAMILLATCAPDPVKDDAQPAASTTETTETTIPETVTETVTPTETAAAPAPRSLDDLYVEKVREVAGVSGDDTTLIALGHGICALFEEGNGLLETGLNLMSENDLTMNQSGSLMGLASAAYCPNFEYLFEE